MTRSELINTLASKQTQLSQTDVELCVKIMLDHMTESLVNGRRVEVRGFGSFTLHPRAARRGRNPKTGEPVDLPAKYVPHFKPGKEMREEVDANKDRYP